jgi:pimeloyl-ACP methyl ester carboxylesterase
LIDATFRKPARGRDGARMSTLKQPAVGRGTAAFLAALTILLVVTLPSGAAQARSRQVVTEAVTFTIRNTNNSAVSCPSDGAAATVKGYLVAPRGLLARKTRRRAVTLYLHGLGFGEWFWNFTSAPAYNYARAQARAGHASVVIDRIGYGASTLPDGNQTCVGAQADAAHQIVGKLRAGDYVSGQDRGRAFAKVALAGHSLGGLIAATEASSFRDVNALLIIDWSDSASETARTTYFGSLNPCRAGGEPAVSGGPPGYAYYGQSPNDFRAVMFHRAVPAVVEAATALRNRDPCGDIVSIPTALLRQGALLPKIRVPVLVVCGTKDVLFTPSACRFQRKRYRRSRDTSLVLVPNAGHALTLERSASRVRKQIGRWLRSRGF